MSVIQSVKEIEALIKAGYPLIYVISSEEARVEKNIREEIAKKRDRNFIIWSVTQGFEEEGSTIPKDIHDPLKSLDNIDKYDSDAIFILKDFHPYLTDPTIVRKLRDIVRKFPLSKKRKHIILLSPIYKAPYELEKDMALIDFDLPKKEEIEEILEMAIQAVPKKENIKLLKDEFLKDKIIEAALGLTAPEVRNVFFKSLVSTPTHDFDIETILNEKKHIIRKSGILEFYESREQFSDIGGLKVLKKWLEKRMRAFTKEARDFGLPIPKGILLLGVPGCGKSLTAKAVGSYWKMPLLRLDVGKVFSSLVGSSEENIRRAIKTAEAVAPSVLWLDELEKGFSGTKSSHESDAGTTARVFASFITWLQEKTSPVFVIATANQVSLLPPELLRKGRFDEIFFVDLPSLEEREEIIKIHIEKLNRRSTKYRDINSFDIKKVACGTQNFSGAEIEQAIISALYDAFEDGKDIDTEGIMRSCGEIIPLSFTMKEEIDLMREWASSRARSASGEKIVVKDEHRILEMEK